MRRDTKESYAEFLTQPAKASGVETPTGEDLVRIDKNRKNKGSNEEWEHPHDPDAKITKMKDGRTHLREHPDILKRLLIHVAGFNLSLVLREMLGLGMARGLPGLTAAALRRPAARRADLWAALWALWIDVGRFLAPTYAVPTRSDLAVRLAA